MIMHSSTQQPRSVPSRSMCQMRLAPTVSRARRVNDWRYR